jgi:small subunit ribosomal protein S15
MTATKKPAAKADKKNLTTKASIKASKKAEVKEKKAKKIAEPVAENLEELQGPSEEKQEIISQFQVKEGDTGSPEVQVALLTKRIEKLVLHLKSNPQDNHSRRGLLGIVSKRRRLLNYLEKKDEVRYKQVIGKLDLK